MDIRPIGSGSQSGVNLVLTRKLPAPEKVRDRFRSNFESFLKNVEKLDIST